MCSWRWTGTDAKNMIKLPILTRVLLESYWKLLNIQTLLHSNNQVFNIFLILQGSWQNHVLYFIKAMGVCVCVRARTRVRACVCMCVERERTKNEYLPGSQAAWSLLSMLLWHLIPLFFISKALYWTCLPLFLFLSPCLPLEVRWSGRELGSFLFIPFL